MPSVADLCLMGDMPAVGTEDGGPYRCIGSFFLLIDHHTPGVANLGAIGDPFAVGAYCKVIEIELLEGFAWFAVVHDPDCIALLCNICHSSSAVTEQHVEDRRLIPVGGVCLVAGDGNIPLGLFVICDSGE